MEVSANPAGTLRGSFHFSRTGVDPIQLSISIDPFPHPLEQVFLNPKIR